MSRATILRYILAFLAGGLSAVGVDLGLGDPACPVGAERPVAPNAEE